MQSSSRSFAYIVLSYFIVKENELTGDQNVANSIREMKIYRALTCWKFVGAKVIIWVLALIFMPALQMVLIAFQVLAVGGHVNTDSDKIF